MKVCWSLWRFAEAYESLLNFLKVDLRSMRSKWTACEHAFHLRIMRSASFHPPDTETSYILQGLLLLRIAAVMHFGKAIVNFNLPGDFQYIQIDFRNLVCTGIPHLQVNSVTNSRNEKCCRYYTFMLYRYKYRVHNSSLKFRKITIINILNKCCWLTLLNLRRSLHFLPFGNLLTLYFVL